MRITTPFSMKTALSASKVSELLSTAVVSPFALFRSRGEFPVAGYVRQDGCVIYARPSIFTHNSFIRVLDLKFIASDDGTLLAGRFRLHRWTSGFMVFWFGCLFLMTFGMFWKLLSRQGIRALGSNLWIYMPFGMMAFGVGIAAFGLWWSSFSEPKVVEFLHDVLGSTAGGGAAASVVGGAMIRPRHEVPVTHPD